MEGYFRPESPSLSALRKITIPPDPVELTSVQKSGYTVREGEAVPSALQSSVTVSGLTASWTNNQEKPTLQDITFEVNNVSVSSHRTICLVFPLTCYNVCVL